MIQSFSSIKLAIQVGNQEAEEWLAKNLGDQDTRRRLANQHTKLAEQATNLASELDAESETKLGEAQRRKAAYHNAFADRLAALERTDLNMSQQPNDPKKFHLGSWLATGLTSNFVFPLITMISVMLLGGFFGWPTSVTLIIAGVGARVVAERTGAGKWSARIWGIVPTVPMIFGWYWIPAVASVLHIWLWKHKDDKPQQNSSQMSSKGKDDLPDEV